ncbi:hypothetical protein Asulf_01506 [Archaeoglobus sulfaticallidus PM70-1]|uniref:Uncharacterized protein n=2 Tax=Archaeoglobus TaxID=2233 RepID=N0BD03_9EURY|nr:hypothetical protein Asulf_01506 [Archaeoglobus sulfaticallidus PM70-1]
MLAEGRPYSEIIAEFKDKIPNLNKTNLSIHKRKHFNFVGEAIEEYYRSQKVFEEAKKKVIDELEALDTTVARAYEILHSNEAEKKPRIAEVWGNLMLRAIKLKHEIAGNIEDPASKLLTFFEEAMKEDE